MKMTSSISVPRNFVNGGVLTQNAIFTKGGIIANLMLDGKEINRLSFQVQKLYNKGAEKRSGIIFSIQDGMAIDLLNAESDIKYPAMNITPNLRKQQEQYSGFAIADNYSLKTLLEYLGFPDELNIYELRRLRDILSSKKELRKLAIPCAYGKIDTRLTNLLDYRQEVKLSNGEYYKFIGEKMPDDGRVYFDKSVPTKIEQQIYPAKLFELLVENQHLGYRTPDKREYDVLQKVQGRK